MFIFGTRTARKVLIMERHPSPTWSQAKKIQQHTVGITHFLVNLIFKTQ